MTLVRNAPLEQRKSTYSNRPFAYGVSSGPTIRALIVSGRDSATIMNVPSSSDVRIFAHSLRMRLLRLVTVLEYCNCLSISADSIRSGVRKSAKITSLNVSEFDFVEKVPLLFWKLCSQVRFVLLD